MLRIICVFVWLSCTNELLSHFLTSSKYLVSCSCYVFLHIAEQICSPLSWVFLERRHIHFIIWKILLRYDSWRVSWIGFSFLFWPIFYEMPSILMFHWVPCVYCNFWLIIYQRKFCWNDEEALFFYSIFLQYAYKVLFTLALAFWSFWRLLYLAFDLPWMQNDYHLLKSGMMYLAIAGKKQLLKICI